MAPLLVTVPAPLSLDRRSTCFSFVKNLDFNPQKHDDTDWFIRTHAINAHLTTTRVLLFSAGTHCYWIMEFTPLAHGFS